MSDVLTRFREREQSRKPSPAPMLERFRGREKELAQPADSLMQRFRVREQKAIEPIAEPSYIDRLVSEHKLEYGKPSPQIDALFERLAQWQAGEYIDLDDKEAITKQWKKVGRFALSSPLIVPQFFHALITDPRATIPGIANMFKDAFNNFATIQSPLSTEEEVRKADEYFLNDPVGLAFSVLILGGIGVRAIKAPRVEGIKAKPSTKVGKIEAMLGKEEIKETPIEAAKVEIEPTVGPAIRQQLPDYLKPAVDELPSRIVNETPILKVIKRGKEPLYDLPTESLEIPLKKFAKPELRNAAGEITELGTSRIFQHEMIASWAHKNLSPKQYNEWRKSVGYPESLDVRGGVATVSNVDAFASSAIDWMRGRPWGESGKLFKTLFGKKVPIEPITPLAWTTRTKDLKRIHVKQKKISTKDPDFREMKKRIAGKESLKDFTQEEMMRFEAELDVAIVEGAKPKQIDLFKTVEELTKEPGEDLINKAPSETMRTLERVTDEMIPEGMFDTKPPSVLETIKGLPKKILPQFFLRQTRTRVKSEPGREMFARLRKGDETKYMLTGTWLTKLKELGLKTIEKRGWGERLADALEGGEAKPFQKLLTEIYNKAKDAGIRVAPFEENYFPRMTKYEISQALQGDVTTILRKAYKLKEDVGPLLKEALEKGQIKPETKRALKHLVDSGQAETYVDAVALLRNFSHNEMFNPLANLVKRRTVKFPLDFYERDAVKVLRRYVRGVAKSIAEAEQFGSKSEIYHDLRNKVDAISRTERQVVDHAIAAWTGAITRDPRYAMTRRWKKFAEVFTHFEVITKIALGTAALRNVTQSFISTIPFFGVFRASRGFYRMLAKPEVRTMFQKSGAPMDIAARTWVGMETTSNMGKVSSTLLNIVGFTPMNWLNSLLSASTVESSLRGYYRLANLKPLETPKKVGRSAHAKRVLEFLNVDWTKPLTEEVTLKAMMRAATDLQVMRNILRDPLSAHNPRLKSAWLFKRFGLKQTILANDIALKEVKYGNVWPILRLAVGGYLGGMFSGWAVNKVRSALSGKEYYAEDKKGWERIVWAWSEVAAFGLVGDIFDSGIFGDYPFDQTIEFAILPVQVQTIGKIADTVIGFINEATGDYGLLGAAKRLKGTAPRLLGPLGTQVGKRLQTGAQRAARLRFERGQVRSKILDLFLDGKDDQAVRVWKAWNKHNSYNIAFGQYDEYGQFLGRLGNIGVLLQNREMERAKKKVRP